MLRQIYQQNKRMLDDLAKSLSTHGIYAYDSPLDGYTIYNNEDCTYAPYCHGLFKVVFLFSNFVVKTPIVGTVDFDKDCAEEEYDDECGYKHVKSNDNCEIEYQIYLEAVKAGVEDFFAETLKISDSAYLQERADMTLDEFYDLPEDEKEAYELDTYYDEIHLVGDKDIHEKIIGYDLKYLFDTLEWDECALEMFCQQYGPEMCGRFSRFLMRFAIDDIHGANIGIIGNQIKLIDFGGCNQTTSEILKSRRERC